jgi:arabinogalactan endo-1,4-beta-galactosidase
MKLHSKLIIVIGAVLLSMMSSATETAGFIKRNKANAAAVFAKGADVSWITQMEKEGKNFYSAAGKQMECIALLKTLGMNSIRLRVWVNPKDGWNGRDDLLVKALRAKKLGMRLMIDFHYSDWWADPGKQVKPAAWKEYSMEQLKQAVSNHTKDILDMLKRNGITPEWVQVGNETTNGMLWPEGGVWIWDENKESKPNHINNYAVLSNAGYDAVKSVFPDAKVIVHIDNGYNIDAFERFFGRLKAHGGKWDVIGMSLYPSYYEGFDKDKMAACDKFISNSMENIQRLNRVYHTPVMVTEIGMPWDDVVTAKYFLSTMIGKTKQAGISKCLGVFYWEPEGFFDWSKYSLCAFDNKGRPTAVMDAFK